MCTKLSKKSNVNAQYLVDGAGTELKAKCSSISAGPLVQPAVQLCSFHILLVILFLIG